MFLAWAPPGATTATRRSGRELQRWQSRYVSPSPSITIAVEEEYLSAGGVRSLPPQSPTRDQPAAGEEQAAQQDERPGQRCELRPPDPVRGRVPATTGLFSSASSIPT